MILFEVTYPFEVNRELSTCHVLYPSLKAARADAKVLYSLQVEEETEAEDGANQPVSHLPAVVRKLTYARPTKRDMCDIINSGGGLWCLGGGPIGEFIWDGKKISFNAQNATPNKPTPAPKQ